ncbi:MAG TPA: patatin-like phospholipase family protein [Xanthobacteraceae bacterium]|jgi:NTE family protein
MPALQALRQNKTHRARPRPPFEQIALVLQGGGALGAYQAGVYEALAEADLNPDWVAGISIGGINTALIAGNAPEARVDKLREFWESVTTPYWKGAGQDPNQLVASGDLVRSYINQMSAVFALTSGASGFFTPRLSVPWLAPAGTPAATSYYDTAPLRQTLERLVDFDRINACGIRFSVGSVNIRTGNFVYFDNTTHTIRPEHVLASGALPPGFPAVEIDGEYYWDGGLVSNTPLQWVMDAEPRRDTLAFQVDLWDARGDVPRTMAQVLTRQKEIVYSSRTRANSDRARQVQQMRNTLATLLQKLPEELRTGPEFEILNSASMRKVYNLVHLIYRAQEYEGDSKDYEFSRVSMHTHWQAGYNDTVRTLRHPEVLERPRNAEGFFTFDLGRDGRE